MSREEPLVSIITPVYNGGPYFVECVESVLAQTYSNWEYTIVNNCSTDGTLDTACRYARRDPRIRVSNNDTFLDIIGNANRAFSLVSPGSKYCKSLSADDWLYPECLSKMVALAEANPGVGLVNSYQLSGSGQNGRNWRVKWAELPWGNTVTAGREICRSQLLGGPYVFGTPSSLLYRSDLVRMYKPFYPNLTAEADTSACYQCLRTSDFGFVHQVLSYERIHEQTISAECRSLNSYESSRLGDLITYGPHFLTESEIDRRLEEILRNYYTFLGVSLFHNRDKAFWAYHTRRLAELGHPLSRTRLARSGLTKFVDLVLNPKRSVEAALRGRQSLAGALPS
jgi:glycosyltransferase involved in cell wall biosynthesis